MQVKHVVTGWMSRNAKGSEQEYSTLRIVVFNLPNDPIDYSGFVILSRHTGRVLIPIFVRIPNVHVVTYDSGFPQPASEDSSEGIQASADVIKQIEAAARKSAGTLVPRIQ